MTVRVILTRNAHAHVQRIDDWWRANRLASPDLFAQELAGAIEALEEAPSIGSTFAHPRVRGLRRVLLRATRFHVYYVVDGDTVAVMAVWSCLRGGVPDLGGQGG